MKIGRVEISAEAEAEITEAVLWYLDRSPGTATTFSQALQEVLAGLEVHPRMGRRWPTRRSSLEVRSLPLRRFPYLLVYLPEPEVRLIALAHTRRMPGYWEKRVH